MRVSPEPLSAVVPWEALRDALRSPVLLPYVKTVKRASKDADALVTALDRLRSMLRHAATPQLFGNATVWTPSGSVRCVSLDDVANAVRDAWRAAVKDEVSQCDLQDAVDWAFEAVIERVSVTVQADGFETVGTLSTFDAGSRFVWRVRVGDDESTLAVGDGVAILRQGALAKGTLLELAELGSRVRDTHETDVIIDFGIVASKVAVRRVTRAHLLFPDNDGPLSWPVSGIRRRRASRSSWLTPLEIEWTGTLPSGVDDVAQAYGLDVDPGVVVNQVEYSRSDVGVFRFKARAALQRRQWLLDARQYTKTEIQDDFDFSTARDEALLAHVEKCWRDAGHDRRLRERFDVAWKVALGRAILLFRREQTRRDDAALAAAVDVLDDDKVRPYGLCGDGLSSPTLEERPEILAALQRAKPARAARRCLLDDETLGDRLRTAILEARAACRLRREGPSPFLGLLRRALLEVGRRAVKCVFLARLHSVAGAAASTRPRLPCGWLETKLRASSTATPQRATALATEPSAPLVSPRSSTRHPSTLATRRHDGEKRRCEQPTWLPRSSCAPNLRFAPRTFPRERSRAASGRAASTVVSRVSC